MMEEEWCLDEPLDVDEWLEQEFGEDEDLENWLEE